MSELHGPRELRAFYEIWSDRIAIIGKVGRCYAKPAEFGEEVERGTPAQAFMHIELSEAQRLMDDLWDAGLRPIAGKQSEGVTAAQAKHLEDMRQIVFAKLNIAQPNHQGEER